MSTIKPKPCKVCGSKYHTKMKCPENPEAVTKARAIQQRMLEKQRQKPVKRSVGYSKAEKAKTHTKKRKESLIAAKKRLEKLVKDYVKQRDDYTCQRCSKVVEGSNCHASHVIPVSRSGYLQFEPLNMKVMCTHCHLHWWHKHPIEAGQWYTDKFPERWEYLDSLHKQRLKPMKLPEILEKIEEYKVKLDELA